MQKKQFETLKGTKQWGYIHTPADRTKKYPLVFFCHGMGEIGNTESTVSRILSHGPLYHINKGWNPDIIVIGIQHHSWSFPADRIMYVLSNDPDIKDLWNGKAMITGLSAGGEIVLNFMRQFHDPNKFVYVPMSPSGNSAGIDNPPYKIWGFVGNNDKATMNALPTLLNLKSKFGAKVTVYNGGHGGWNTYYDPAHFEDGINIYGWAFDAVTDNPPPTTKKLISTIQLFDDGSYLKTDV